MNYIHKETYRLDERRRYERTSASIRVEIHHPAIGTIVGFTNDISDGGARVTLDGEVSPPAGTDVMVRFKKVVGTINQEPVPMKVMHVTKNVVGLMFLSR